MASDLSVLSFDDDDKLIEALAAFGEVVNKITDKTRPILTKKLNHLRARQRMAEKQVASPSPKQTRGGKTKARGSKASARSKSLCPTPSIVDKSKLEKSSMLFNSEKEMSDNTDTGGDLKVVEKEGKAGSAVTNPKKKLDAIVESDHVNVKNVDVGNATAQTSATMLMKNTRRAWNSKRKVDDVQDTKFLNDTNKFDSSLPTLPKVIHVARSTKGITRQVNDDVTTANNVETNTSCPSPLLMARGAKSNRGARARPGINATRMRSGVVDPSAATDKKPLQSESKQDHWPNDAACPSNKHSDDKMDATFDASESFQTGCKPLVRPSIGMNGLNNNSGSRISMHVLDTSVGAGVGNLQVTISAECGTGNWQQLAAGITGADGRCDVFSILGVYLDVGVYKARFESGQYFRSTNTKTSYPYVEVVFEVADTSRPYHMTLLINPFGFTTYSGV